MNKVYTNKNTSLTEWTVMAGKIMWDNGVRDMPRPLAAQHAYELGYTPQSWAREVRDSLILKRQNALFRKNNPYGSSPDLI